MGPGVRVQLAGRVKLIALGGVVGDDVSKLDGETRVVFEVTRASMEPINLSIGNEAVAIIEVSNLLVGRSISAVSNNQRHDERPLRSC